MKTAVLTFLQLLPLVVLPQTFDAGAKTTGYIKTTEGKFEGTVDVNPALDQALWTEGNKTRIFGAGQIKELKLIYPTGTEIVYYGYEIGGDHYLFEALTTGKIRILYKEGVRKNRYDETILSPYFSVGKGKELVSLSREKDFLEIFGDDEKWMKQAIKNRNLSLEKKDDIRTAFNYYNQQYELINP